LEYLFAGTGAKNYRIDFNISESTDLPGKIENLLVGMIADANRIRSGDFIIFYLQQDRKHKIQDGKFYGIFKAKNDGSFLDNNDRQQYLKGPLRKSLTFRTLIEPYRIYPAGVTEWEALDEIKNIRRPDQMLWSLIYRKLKANRGNTMITIYESEKLCQLIRNKNHKHKISCNDKLLSFNLETQNIICVDEPAKPYEGRVENIDVLPRLIRKLIEKKSFEPHLQAYIVKNIGMGINKTLDSSILGNGAIEWIGNEVSCGVGMQKIDVLLSVTNSRCRTVVPIELKTCLANERFVNQLQRYINWIEQYYIPNRKSHIQPILVCRQFAQKQTVKERPTEKYKRLINSFNKFNESNRHRCYKLKYVEFEIQNEDIIFKKIDY